MVVSRRYVHFMGLTQHEDVMTSKMCVKNNHPHKPKWLLCTDGLTGTTYCGQATEWLTSNQIDSSLRALPGGMYF